MSSAASAPERLLTAEEYLLLPDDGTPNELVRGRVVEMGVPMPRHGEICMNVMLAIGPSVKSNKLGRLLCNDSGVVTERGPDTVRGADLSFYSFKRVPPGPMPKGYLTVMPEVVFEVRSPNDRWAKILAKVAEYLEAGVSVVCVLDPVYEAMIVYFPGDEIQRTMHNSDEFHLPDLLGDLRVPVSRFFE